MAESAGRGGREAGQSPSAPVQHLAGQFQHLAPGGAAGPFPFPGQGHVRGSSSQTHPMCTLPVNVSGWGSPRPRFSSQIPIGVWETHGAELFALSGSSWSWHRGTGETAEPSLPPEDLQKALLFAFSLLTKGTFIPNGCRRHMWSRSYCLSAEAQAGCPGCLPDTWPSEAPFPVDLEVLKLARQVEDHLQPQPSGSFDANTRKNEERKKPFSCDENFGIYSLSSFPTSHTLVFPLCSSWDLLTPGSLDL